jgi:16S rRNA (cytosine967-C5)-methyltransferase
MEPEEGPRIVERLMQVCPDLEVEDASQFLPQAVVEGRFMSTAPHKHGTDGAFAARLKRRA